MDEETKRKKEPESWERLIELAKKIEEYENSGDDDDIYDFSLEYEDDDNDEDEAPFG